MSRYITVDGQPFFILGGQVHNSSAYTKERMASLWDVLTMMHANTGEVPVYWEQIEPQEGTFDLTIVDDLLAGAREHGLKLILLWFATWKNGTMKYAPRWVKLQRERFQRVITPDGDALPVLSPHCTATREADKRAFCTLLSHLQRVDSVQHTVIAIQVQNEPGSQGSERDFSAQATALFEAFIPDQIAALLPQATRPALRAAWESRGVRQQGTWSEMLGPRADEAFNAWHIARYIDDIAATGKAIYDLPMYVNVWLSYGFRQAGYDYPSGGAVSDMIDIWKAAAPHIDLLAPDIYMADTSSFLK